MLDVGPARVGAEASSTSPWSQPAVTGSSGRTVAVSMLPSQHLHASYHPAGRYWPFRWIETAIFLALASALASFCFRRIPRV